MPFAAIPLIQTPTPLHRLDRASADLGIDLWIKRDDLTGFAGGGNKGRKLEYLIAAALAAGADTVVTCGSTQSNFVRQLGAACAVTGLRCVAAVMDLPYEDELPTAERLRNDVGNSTLNRLFGVELVAMPDGTWDDLYAAAEAEAQRLEADGRRVYRIPIGGSSALGAFAFAQAAEEVRAQADPFDWIITASSSGSTQTGLAHAFAGSTTRVVGILSDPEPEIVHDFARLAADVAELIGEAPQVTATDFRVNIDFVGPGYGVPSEEGDRALEWLARKEGILLDPIYSAKAFAAVIALARSREISGRVLFWHTGGVPTVFAMPTPRG